MQNLLESAGLVAGYNGVPVVRDVDLEVRAGEIVVLLGANGAGKTTFLRTLVGSLPSIAGEVRWRGAKETAPLHRRVVDGLGYVPETRSTFAQLTVRDNLRVGRGSIETALRLFPELTDHLKRRAGDLSGGQQQILTLARVLAAEPAVVVADELSLGLAPLIVKRLMAALTDAAGRGVGVLFVEQHVDLALEIAHRAYVLRRGRLVKQGDAATLRANRDELGSYYLANSADPEEPAEGK